MKIIFEFKSNSLPLDLNNLFQENKEINCHFTCNVIKEGLYIPQIRTNRLTVLTVLTETSVNLTHQILVLNYFEKSEI